MSQGTSIRVQRAPSKTTESWAAHSAQKYQGSANGSCWKPAATQGRADPQDGEQGNTEKNQFVLKLCCVYSRSTGGSASAQVPVGLPGAQGGDGRTIPSPDNALLSFSMEKSEYHPLITGFFAVFTDSRSRSRSFRNIMSFGSPEACCEQSEGAFIK